jgi:LysW-gamma-L-lysine carboxypeptidase
MSELLIDLVRCYSPSYHEAAAVDVLVRWLRAHGFRAGVDAAGSAVGERGPHDAPHTLMLLGHIDTFPGELPVEVRDGVLYGRGSVDAKGPLCAFAEAAAAAALPPGWRVIVAGAVEEEAATGAGARLLRETVTPDLCLIGEPSGSTRLTLGYKGRLIAHYNLRRPSAHTARPEPSAAALGAAFWARVEAWATAQSAGHAAAFDQVWAHLRAINSESDALSDTVDLSISLRLPPALPPEAAREAVLQCADADAALLFTGAERAVQADRHSPLVRAMLGAVRAVTGERPGFVLKTGTSDWNAVAERWTCPILAYGPGDSALDHTPEEHLPLSEYATAVAVLTHFIEHLTPPVGG